MQREAHGADAAKGKHRETKGREVLPQGFAQRCQYVGIWDGEVADALIAPAPPPVGVEVLGRPFACHALWTAC